MNHFSDVPEAAPGRMKRLLRGPLTVFVRGFIT